MKWSKDGELVQQGDRVKLLDSAVSGTSELKISHTTVADSGVYSAEASNLHGTVQTTAVVLVTESVEKISKEHHETSVVEISSKTVEDTEEISVREDIVVVMKKKEKAEKEETHVTQEEISEISTERVEIMTDSSSSHQQTSVAKEAMSTQSSATYSGEVKVSEVTTMLQEDVVVIPADILAAEDKVQIPIFADEPQSLELELPESVKEPEQEPVKELAKEPQVEKPVIEPEKPSAVKKQLVLESVKVEEEQFEKVVQELSEEVYIEENVETKRLAFGFEKTKDEGEAERILTKEPKETESATPEDETEKEMESEPEPLKEPEQEPINEPVKEPQVEKPVIESEKPTTVKKQLVLEGVKVEEEQFEKVVQEVSEEVHIEETVETKILASGFGAATVSELTSESLTLNWEEPKNTGGVKIIHYLIVMKETDSTKYKKIAQVDGDVHSYTVTKVKKGHEYHFRVYAQNEVGISTEAAEIATSVKIPKTKKEKKPADEPTKPAEAVEEVVEAEVSLSAEKAKDEAEAELTLIEEPKVTVIEPIAEEKMEEEEELEPVKEPEKEPVEEPVEETEVDKPVIEPEKTVAVKKQLVLEGAKVEEEQFEKVVQEIGEEVHIEETRVVTVSGDETIEVSKTSLVTETKTISHDEKSDNRISVAEEVQGAAVSDSLVTEGDYKAKVECLQDIQETSRTAEPFAGGEPQVNLETMDSTLIAAVEETVSTKEEEVINNSEEKLEGLLPVLKVKPLPTKVVEGELLRLVCEVAEETKVEITWSKDGKKLEITDMDARIRTVEDKVDGVYLLEIAETTTEDIGEYTLSAESEGGVISCTVSVDIIAKLEPELPLSTVSEQTSLTYILPQRKESDVDAEGTLSLERTEDLDSVVSKHDVEVEQQKENMVAVAEMSTAATEHKVAEEPSIDHEVTAIEEEVIDSRQAEIYTEVHKSEAETTPSTETVSETAVISKETVTKKKSEEKLEKTSSETVDITQKIDELEQEVSKEVTVENTLQKEVTEETGVEMDHKTATESVTVVEDVVRKSASEEVAAAEVEEIDVEYLEEEFEGPLPVIEVKPVPIAVNASETVRLFCKVAEEPAAEVRWSRKGHRLETTPDSKKINTGVDVTTGMHFLEITEASLEDIGEYTLTAESEGGIVSCTVSVDVRSELEVSSAVKRTLQSGTVSENVQQIASESTEPLGTVETGQVVVIEGSEMPRAHEAAPAFVSVPQPVYVKEGSPVRLQCQVKG